MTISIIPVTSDDVSIMFIDVILVLVYCELQSPLLALSCFWMTRKSFGSRVFSGRVLVSCRQRTSVTGKSL